MTKISFALIGMFFIGLGVLILYWPKIRNRWVIKEERSLFWKNYIRGSKFDTPHRRLAMGFILIGLIFFVLIFVFKI